MTDKFIAVANKQEADRAAKYLESLGYRLDGRGISDTYKQTTLTISTSEDIYYYSDISSEYHIDQYEEEQLFVPDDFDKPIQDTKDDYVLSGVWQYYSPNDCEWITDSNQNRYTRQLIESQGVKTRDLYIKA